MYRQIKTLEHIAVEKPRKVKSLGDCTRMEGKHGSKLPNLSQLDKGVGFLKKNNYLYNLNDEDKIEYLMAVGDTVYNALDKYQRIITFALDNNLLN